MFGTSGELLNFGRRQCTAPEVLKQALAARDRGCSFLGCDAPVAQTEVHHVRWWHRDLGQTNLDETTLNCSFHHHLVHRDVGRQMVMIAGVPHTIAPA